MSRGQHFYRATATLTAWVAIAGAPAVAQSPPERALIEDFRIDGTAFEFNRIMGIAVASNGIVLVAHDGNLALTLFSPAGKQLKSFARKGAGPGELAQYASMGTVGDSLWLCDASQNRLTLFGTDGSLGRMIPLDGNSEWVKTRPAAKGIIGVICPLRLLPDNTGFGQPGVFSQFVADGTIQSVPILRTTSEGVVTGVITQVPTGRGQLTIRSGGMIMFSRQPFAIDPAIVASPDGRRLAIVDFVTADKPVIRVTHLSLKGDTIARIAVPFVPERIPKRVVDSAVATVASRPQLKGNESVVRAAIVVPDVFAPFKHALMDNDGATWLEVRSGDTTSVRWLVVSPQGRVTATVTLPKNVAITWLDRGIWAIVSDADGVPSIVRYRMR